MSETLNPAQLEAVYHLGSPCLVLAGAGSGKTRVIVHKIAKLLQSGLEARQIAAITFTNKAAAEMRERAKGLVGARAAKDLAVSTFHALGVRLLRADGQVLGLKPQFSIMDSDDVLGVLRDAGGTTDAKLARHWQWTISLWKNQGLDSAGAMRIAADADEQLAARVMQRYEERLSAYQAVDFDDLIGLPLKLLQTDAQVRAKWQHQFRHILVDEVQDTNAVQYELLKVLLGERGLFTAVGDDDQSIYGWRGATIENLKRLPQDYPQLKVIALEQNYRSTANILRAANHVIAANPKLYPKKLWSALGEGEPVRVLECDGEEHEAERAVAHIQARRAEGGAVKLGDFAVLYRANHQARVFEQKLRAAQLPYKVSGGQSFFDRAEIRDLCAWLRLWVNQDDDPAFLRAVTTPKRGIGPQTLAALGEFAGRWKCSLFEALFSASLASTLNPKALGSLREFGRHVNDLEHRARHTVGSEDAKPFLLGWLKDIGYEQHLFDAEDSAKLAAARWTNVLDFVDWISRRCGGTVSQEAGSFESEKLSVLDVAQTDQRDHQPGRARRRAGRDHAVDLARGQGPGVAARAAGRRQRRPAAVQERRGRDGHRAARGRAPPDVRRRDPRPHFAGGEHAAAQEARPRHGRRRAQPLHRRDEIERGHGHQGEPARAAQAPAGRSGSACRGGHDRTVRHGRA